ncbi:MAG: iron-sulfur cluster repair di-iron protein [Acidobacteria bacterium]|jgi:regulator of cell morphogenesis and NO signaling|nr:MAG: iron-sulfur cluster repair di-iron protein [Acidobacteriota bacterium]GIU81510.1 MAG: iron-sulfur cluster repair di-iron protein [Pyrinomonadaceae bacterium]
MQLEFQGKTIREIALEYPQSVRVFERYKIDYCCGGRKFLEEVCQSLGLEAEKIWHEIQNEIAENSEQTEFPERKKASELVDYILEKHHVYTKDAIERLKPLMEKVCRRHGKAYPELLELQKAFLSLADELLVHMKKEEMVLFPYIKVLSAVVSTNFPISEPHFGTVKNPVRMMMLEHDASGDILRQMRSITNDYSLPEGACPSFTALYYELEELEKDLHRHIHLENNVLFPQAVELEEKVLGERINDSKADFCCHTRLS